MPASIFHPDFKPMPYWWEAWRPTADGAEMPVPTRTDVAIVGAGYTGLSTAIELADSGIQATVIEAHEPGFGASTRSGGGVVEVSTSARASAARALIPAPNALPACFTMPATPFR